MLVEMLHAKIHRATVTDANLNYVGSITIDEDLLDASGILPGQKVQIVNNNNGERFETYVLLGKRGSKEVCLNGAAARRVEIGDTIIVIAYGTLDYEDAKNLKQTIVFVDKENNITSIEGGE